MIVYIVYNVDYPEDTSIQAICTTYENAQAIIDRLHSDQLQKYHKSIAEYRIEIWEVDQLNGKIEE